MLKLNKDYRLNADEFSIHVEKRQTGKKKDAWKIVGYHTTLASALKSVAEREIRNDLSDENKNDIKTAIEKVDELKRICEKATVV